MTILLQRSGTNLELRKIVLQGLFVLKNVANDKIEPFMQALLSNLEDSDLKYLRKELDNEALLSGFQNLIKFKNSIV